MTRVRSRLADERGYSLVEMLTVMVILSIVMTGLTTLFVQASNAEVDMNNRFQAQQEARVALDKLRRETHCASGVGTWSSTSVTLTLASYCPTGNGSITWCALAVPNTTQRYALYRTKGATCTSTGSRFADYLTTPNLFTYYAQTDTTLAKLHVELPVNLTPKKGIGAYNLRDDIVLRNTTRDTPTP